jgi:hypothetical protein
MQPDHDAPARPDPRLRRGARSVSLGLVLLCLGATLVLGAATKSPCISGDWTGQQYDLLCYTDLIPLLTTEQLAGGRLPYLDACTPNSDARCDEYPVLTMYFMRVAGWLSDANYSGFFAANAALLWVCAAAIAICLYLLVGARALYFALSPTLLIYGLVNWDLFAVALATAAALAFFNRRDVLAGVLLGLGASAKFYPAMLVVPFIAQRLQDREPDGAIRLGWATAGTWIVVNLPFALVAPSAWFTFFRFNSERCADFDSLWSIGWRYLDHDPGVVCTRTGFVNAASLALFLALTVIVWAAKERRVPGFPRWSLMFPVVVLFLLTNKVYSPQYGLWLLPLFAIAFPNLRAFVAFSIADVAVFVTRFWWFGELSGQRSWPEQWAFELAVLVRAAVLIWCLVAWIRRPPDPVPGALPAREPVPAEEPA